MAHADRRRRLRLALSRALAAGALLVCAVGLLLIAVSGLSFAPRFEPGPFTPRVDTAEAASPPSGDHLAGRAKRGGRPALARRATCAAWLVASPRAHRRFVRWAGWRTPRRRRAIGAMTAHCRALPARARRADRLRSKAVLRPVRAVVPRRG